MFSDGPLHKDEQVLDDLLELDLQQHCTDTRCILKDLLEVKDDRDKWQEEFGISVLAVWHDDIYVYVTIAQEGNCNKLRSDEREREKESGHPSIIK